MNNDFIIQTKTDIGLRRNKNEDSVLAICHPNNKNIKLLAVADGMGGRASGEVASSYTINSLYQFFINTSISCLNNTLEIANLLKNKVLDINNELIKKYGLNNIGTTLTLSLINEADTVILNIGDSRAYLFNNGYLNQVTDDDSVVWTYYKDGYVSKDDLRFLSNNHIINACVGLNYELCNPQVITKNNDSYDKILLLTDGITDLLSDIKIEFLVNNTKEEEITEQLIAESVYIDQDLNIPFRLKRKFFNNLYIPKAGDDNASAVLLIKK